MNAKHNWVQKSLLDACGLKPRGTVVEWQVFMKFMSYLKYRSLPYEHIVAFWLKIFNPTNLKHIDSTLFAQKLEFLSRESDTEDKLVSGRFH